MVKETGWMLEIVDALKMGDWMEWLMVRDGKSKAGKTLVRKQ